MEINIGGLQKFSLSDYPNKIAAIVFLRGCNFRCSYCHNVDLWDTTLQSMPLETIFDFLKRRRKQLNAVVISGGEPTIYADLPLFLKEIKKLNYDIKLNTNGSYPDRLDMLIQKKLLDYIAMDIKAPLEKYSAICMREIDVETIQKSISLITKSDIPHEFRTTDDLKHLSKEDLQQIKKFLIPRNSQYYINHAR